MKWNISLRARLTYVYFLWQFGGTRQACLTLWLRHGTRGVSANKIVDNAPNKAGGSTCTFRGSFRGLYVFNLIGLASICHISDCLTTHFLIIDAIHFLSYYLWLPWFWKDQCSNRTTNLFRGSRSIRYTSRTFATILLPKLIHAQTLQVLQPDLADLDFGISAR